MNKSLTTRALMIISIFTAVTAVLAQIAIPVPFSPMPISFGLVAVYITGMLLKPQHAVITQICYLLLGAVGAPVFHNFQGGLGTIVGPTGGYLMVYPVMAFIVAMTLNSRKSLKLEHGQSKRLLFIKSALSICTAHLVLYLGGTVWLCFTMGYTFQAGLALAVYPFIPLDVIKIIFCIMVITPLRSRLLSMNLLILK